MINSRKFLLRFFIISFIGLGFVPFAQAQSQKVEDMRLRVKDSQEKLKHQQQEAETTLQHSKIMQGQGMKSQNLTQQQQARDALRDMQERNRQMQQQQQQMLRDRLRDIRK